MKRCLNVLACIVLVLSISLLPACGAAKPTLTLEEFRLAFNAVVSEAPEDMLAFAELGTQGLDMPEDDLIENGYWEEVFSLNGEKEYKYNPLTDVFEFSWLYQSEVTFRIAYGAAESVRFSLSQESLVPSKSFGYVGMEGLEIKSIELDGEEVTQEELIRAIEESDAEKTKINYRIRWYHEGKNGKEATIYYSYRYVAGPNSGEGTSSLSVYNR